MKLNGLVNAGLGMVVACAVVITGLLVRRELSPASVSERSPNERLRIVDDWRRYSTEGHRAGPKDAVVTITEFSDFE
jgi:hypothetical protein